MAPSPVTEVVPRTRAGQSIPSSVTQPKEPLRKARAACVIESFSSIIKGEVKRVFLEVNESEGVFISTTDSLFKYEPDTLRKSTCVGSC